MAPLTDEQQNKVALEDRRAVLDAGLQMMRWLIATLFLLNGAAALATINMEGLDPAKAAIIAVTFVNGMWRQS